MEVTTVRSYKNSVTVKIPVTSGNSNDKMHEICLWGIETLTGCIEIHQEITDIRYLIILCEFEEDATLVALKWGNQ